ncbi:bifunctional nicotinamidase/pyrazinamidase [uncultured Apibacter sp.]|uniref:bifunctional nicotinamidase/pyrazinamidase n=1 Tax=uncultured Apibacter sp. TaxID=1778616 RepID=UPI0025E69662|nr:bifunctional nicotinamidase/pyrazinamidase [uncultured Apibacter sp.]
MKALIIVDMQNDFLQGGKLAVHGGNEIISIINKIQGKFDLVVATQDWHPNDHRSFASQHQGKNVYEKIDLLGMEQILWPDHCIQGTFGAEISSDLSQNRIEAIFRKGMNKNIDSYSGFFDNGKLKCTGLGDFFKGREISEVYVCGLAADYCVYYTAKDALELGFKTFIIENATKAIDAVNFDLIKESFVINNGNITNLFE